MKNGITARLKSWGVIVAGAILMALSYELFVFPNSFAPAGINGLAISFI